MGAVFFMALMLALLCFGGFLLLLGLIFLFLRHRGRKKGTPKGLHTALAGVFLTLGAVACALPVGYWLFLRAVNSSMDKGYVDTGRFVEGGFQDGTFTVDGMTYERLDVARSGLCPKGEAVFSWDSSNGWSRFFGYYDRGNYLAIENALGLDLIRDDSIHDRLWCRSDQFPQAQAWYGDDKNYQWYLCDYDYEAGKTTYTPLDRQPDREHMAALRTFQAEEREGETFTLSRNAEIPEYTLVSISTDRVAYQDYIYLAVYDGRLCLMGQQSYTGDTRTDTAYPLPADLAGYFSQLLR